MPCNKSRLTQRPSRYRNYCVTTPSLAKLPTCLHEEHTMVRILFWIALIGAAVWLWRRFKAPQRRTQQAEQHAAPMVRCAQCGVHVPRTAALPHQQSWYCSQAHLPSGHSAE